ncbi:hypothetical protein BDD12DRAFT_803159 [Trichophaea hybrida]|nr:hypothetical protein BDD12DRAFT_803159 [Trichophaea hybrida]
MYAVLFLLGLALPALAERPFLNEPDTGLVIDTVQIGALPALKDMFTAPDFEAAARHMPIRNYSMVLTDNGRKQHITAQAQRANSYSIPEGSRDLRPSETAATATPRQLNLAAAAGKAGILYAPSLSATKPIEEIAAAAPPGSILFHQLYVSANRTKLLSDLKRIEDSGFKAIFVTVDNPIHGIRSREARYGFSNVTDHDPHFSWRSYAELRKLTKLPVIPKGIQTVEGAKMAVEAGAPAIYISNHGGRQLDYSQLPIETVLEIYTHAPEIFKKTEVFADGGDVKIYRYTDFLNVLC